MESIWNQILSLIIIVSIVVAVIKFFAAFDEHHRKEQELLREIADRLKHLNNK